jgi:VWFA-related protein
MAIGWRWMLNVGGMKRTLHRAGAAILATVILCAGVLVRDGDARARAQAAAQSDASQAAAAQQAPTPQAAAPITTETRLVQLNVIVHDKHGAPIDDLTKDDFIITDNKAPQTVRMFSKEAPSAADVAAAAADAPEPGTFSNRARAGAGNSAITIILIDQLNTAPNDQAMARKKVLAFLAQIQPQDRVALYTLGRGLRVIHDFSSDASGLVAAVAALNGKNKNAKDALAANSPSADGGFGAQSYASGLDSINFLVSDANQREAAQFTANRVQETVAAMKTIADHVGGLPGRKNLIWVSGSFPIAFGLDNTTKNIYATAEGFNAQVEDAARAMNAANLAVYPVDARGMIAMDTHASGFKSQDSELNMNSQIATDNNPSTASEMAVNSTGAMDALAKGTGGKAFYNTNDISGAIRHAIDDSKVSYTLGYSPEGMVWDGKFHEVRVSVKRPDARVETRRGYFALPDPKPTPMTREQVIAQAARSSLDATEIGMTARFVPGATARSMRVSVAVDLHGVRFSEQGGLHVAAVDVVLLTMNDQNKILSAFDQTFPLNLGATFYEQLMKDGMFVTKELAIPDGAIQVRVVARDPATGALGAVRIPVPEAMQNAKAWTPVVK